MNEHGMHRQGAWWRAATAFVAFAVLLWCGAFLPSVRAAGEPEVVVSLTDTDITLGETAMVTLFFSAEPVGFDETDVDLTSANGTLSGLTVTSDPRVWTAVFTPNINVDAVGNVILVTAAWTDINGLAPLATSASPSFLINTIWFGKSACTVSSITLGSPNGGESLTVGDETDVFWTMNGCQVSAVVAELSVDGGPYTEIVRSLNPVAGHARWTVPDWAAGAATLRLTLLGQGGDALAADMSDGTLGIARPVTVLDLESDTTDDPTPGDATGVGTEPPVEPEEPDNAGPTLPAKEISPEPSPAQSPVEPPPTAIETKDSPLYQPQAPGNNPLYQPDANVRPSNPLYEETMPASNPLYGQQDMQAPPDAGNPAAGAVSVEAVQGALDAGSSFVPEQFSPTLSFLLGALSMLALLLGGQAAMRRARTKSGHDCKYCHGSGTDAKEESALRTCSACNGAGQVEEEGEHAVECKHCEGEGEDPCHACKGEGKDASGQECVACKGEGVTLDKEGEPSMCCTCRGEGEVSATAKKMAPCEQCGGTGKL